MWDSISWSSPGDLLLDLGAVLAVTVGALVLAVRANRRAAPYATIPQPEPGPLPPVPVPQPEPPGPHPPAPGPEPPLPARPGGQ